MNKITFKDLPSTETPLSASNLNQMQTNIENAIKLTKNIIEVRPSTTTLTSNSEQTLQLHTEVPIKNGNLLSKSGNTVVIGQGVSIIKVSFAIWFQSGSAGKKYFNVKLNSETKKTWVFRFDTAPDYENIVGTAIFKVNAGDVISFSLRGTTNDLTNANVGSQYIDIEVIA